MNQWLSIGWTVSTLAAVQFNTYTTPWLQEKPEVLFEHITKSAAKKLFPSEKPAMKTDHVFQHQTSSEVCHVCVQVEVSHTLHLAGFTLFTVITEFYSNCSVIIHPKLTSCGDRWKQLSALSMILSTFQSWTGLYCVVYMQAPPDRHVSVFVHANLSYCCLYNSLLKGTCKWWEACDLDAGLSFFMVHLHKEWTCLQWGWNTQWCYHCHCPCRNDKVV